MIFSKIFKQHFSFWIHNFQQCRKLSFCPKRNYYRNLYPIVTISTASYNNILKSINKKKNISKNIILSNPKNFFYSKTLIHPASFYATFWRLGTILGMKFCFVVFPLEDTSAEKDSRVKMQFLFCWTEVKTFYMGPWLVITIGKTQSFDLPKCKTRDEKSEKQEAKRSWAAEKFRGKKRQVNQPNWQDLLRPEVYQLRLYWKAPLHWTLSFLVLYTLPSHSTTWHLLKMENLSFINTQHSW